MQRDKVISPRTSTIAIKRVWDSHVASCRNRVISISETRAVRLRQANAPLPSSQIECGRSVRFGSDLAPCVIEQLRDQRPWLAAGSHWAVA